MTHWLYPEPRSSLFCDAEAIALISFSTPRRDFGGSLVRESCFLLMFIKISILEIAEIMLSDDDCSYGLGKHCSKLRHVHSNEFQLWAPAMRPSPHHITQHSTCCSRLISVMMSLTQVQWCGHSWLLEWSKEWTPCLTAPCKLWMKQRKKSGWTSSLGDGQSSKIKCCPDDLVRNWNLAGAVMFPQEQWVATKTI